MEKVVDFIREHKKIVLSAVIVILAVAMMMGIYLIARGNRVESDIEDRTESSEKETSLRESEENTTEKETTMETTTDNTTEQTLIDTTVGESMGYQDETTEEMTTGNQAVNQGMPYKIMVNRAANCITVYGKDGRGQYTVPVKAITCSTGKNVGDTPLGRFRTLRSYSWLLMVDGSYGQYAYRFYGSILFHSVPYYSRNKSDLEWEQYNKLGEPASLGCVRVCVADAIWLIQNCAVGTTVEVYDDASNPGPLGKPETIKIPADSPYRGWDPTDPDVNNPWHQCSPRIETTTNNITVEKGMSTEQLKQLLGIRGYDTCGNDVSGKVTIANVDLQRAGTYTSSLNLTDAIGKKAGEVKVQVVVKDSSQPTTAPKPSSTAPPETTTEQETTTVKETEKETTTEQTTTEETTTETTTSEETTVDQTESTEKEETR